MKRIFILGGCLVLSACASDGLDEPELMPAGFFESDSGYSSPSRPSASSSHNRAQILGGFELVGDSFTGDITYEDEGGQLAVYYEHRVQGAPSVSGDLAIHEPWLEEGKRLFEGETYSGLSLKVEMEAGPCRAGDQVYSHFADVQAGRLSYQACARETGPVESWSETLFAHLPEIQSCHRAASVRSVAYLRGAGERQVTHVRAEGPDVIVRFEYPDAGRIDCVVELDQNDRAEPFIAWNVVLDGEPYLPGEGAPVFVLGSLPPSGSACYQWERVRDENGALIGALGHDVCASGRGGPILGG